MKAAAAGIEADLIKILSQYSEILTTYAGGIASMDDINLLNRLGHAKIDFTVGSALNLFGGSLSYEALARTYRS